LCVEAVAMTLEAPVDITVSARRVNRDAEGNLFFSFYRLHVEIGQETGNAALCNAVFCLPGVS